MKNRQYAVLGLGRFGSSIAQELYKENADVLAVDQSADLVSEIQGSVTHAVQADVTDITVLRELGLQDFDVAIVTIGEDLKASSVATMLLKELGVPMVLAKAQDEMHGRMLEKLGADRVIYAERDMGKRVAHSLLSGNILDYIQLSDDFAIVEIVPHASWVGRTLIDLNLRRKFGINVIAIRSEGAIHVSFAPETVIHADDRLLIIGEQTAISKLDRSK